MSRETRAARALAADLAYLWRAYERAALPDRLFVLARRAVCPWRPVVAALPETGRVLDVGCGRGLLAALVRRDRPALEYVGIDISEGATRVARAALGETSARFHTLEEALWEGLGTFECVVLVDVLYAVRLERWPALLARCVEHLRPGGLLVAKETVSTPRWKKAVVTAQETVAIRVWGYTEGEPPHFEPEESYREALRGCGLELLSSHGVGALRPWPHHLFVARRP